MFCVLITVHLLLPTSVFHGRLWKFKMIFNLIKGIIYGCLTLAYFSWF